MISQMASLEHALILMDVMSGQGKRIKMAADLSEVERL